MTSQGAARYEVVAIFGPTGSGKSAIAEEVAGRLGAEVVSADAMQVYRGVPILTNQSHIPTRLVGVRELSDTMNLGEYARLAHEAIDECVERTGVVVVAGGTGLYLRAVARGLAVDDLGPAETFYAKALGWTFNDYGPDYAGIKDPRNPGEEFGGLSRHAPGSRGEGVLALVRSGNADDTLANVLGAGGRIHVEMHEYPGRRRFTFADPSGNILGVYQPLE
jgi:hypothetical protein